MKKFTFCILLFIGIATSAQSDFYLKTYVVEKGTTDTIRLAKVEIKELGLMTHTKEDGSFEFDKNVPEGDYVVSIIKPNYKDKVFLVSHKKGFKINLEKIELEISRKEAKRRAKIKKQQEKLAKKKLKQVQGQLKKEGKALRKQKELLLKQNSVNVKYDSLKEPKVKEVEEEPISETQKKYAKLLNVDPLELNSKKIYDFIDKWIGTPYKWGGETRESIDCSAFTQRLFAQSYGMYLERMAIKQFDSKYTDLFKNYKHLNEGDLLFFGKDQFNITHVGVYLHNNKFVHATSSTVDGPSGVKISDLTNEYWAKLLVSAGRRIKQ